MAARKQHPRITVTNSPEQGEISGEEDYNAEKDAHVKRQREETQQAKARVPTSRVQSVVLTRYPKDPVTLDTIKESRAKKLESKIGSPSAKSSREEIRAKRPLVESPKIDRKVDSPKRTKPLRKLESGEVRHDTDIRRHRRDSDTGKDHGAGRTRRESDEGKDEHHGKKTGSGRASLTDPNRRHDERERKLDSKIRMEVGKSDERRDKRIPAAHRTSPDPEMTSQRHPDSRQSSTGPSKRKPREIAITPPASPVLLAEPTLSRRASVADLNRASQSRQSAGSGGQSKSGKNIARSVSPLSESDREVSPLSEGSALTKSRGSDEEGVYGPMRSRFESESAGTYGLMEVEASSPDSETTVDEEEVPDDSGLPPYFPGIDGCRSVDEFECINRIEEGTYGVVYRARDKRTDEVVALKRLKMEKEKEGFPITSLREVSTLLKAHHPNVVAIKEVVVGHNMDKIYMVMEFVEHDLKALMEQMRQPFSIGEVKTLLRQLLHAVRHLHDNWIVHRDLKTSNLLLNHRGILKVADFGLAREYGSPLRPYTPVVVTLWYRSPELLLGIKEYNTPIDIWSVGCIFAEFLTLKPLFPGKSELEQITRIFKELGNPSEANWPGYSDLPLVKNTTFVEYPYNVLRKRFPPTVLTNSGYDLLSKLLEYNPKTRITADEALKHPHFRDMPLPVDPSMFPTWPARSEQAPRGSRKDRDKTPDAPGGGQLYREMADADGLDGFRIGGQKEANKLKGEGFHLKF